MKITAEHISLATGKQLCQLFGASENTIAAWTVGAQEVSGRLLSRAAAKGIPKDILMAGLDLRREKAELKSKKQQELGKYLDTLAPAIHAA